MVLVRDEQASYEIDLRNPEETAELLEKSNAQAAVYLANSPEYVFLQNPDEFYKPEDVTVQQANQLFDAYFNVDSYGFSQSSVGRAHFLQTYHPSWIELWTAPPSEWPEYATFVELAPIILEQATLWNHPGSGMTASEVALWMFANLHQESRLKRISGFFGIPGFLHDPGGWLEDKLGDMAVVANPSLGPANIRPTVADEMLMEELRLPMPDGLEESISDDQLGANRLDELNFLRGKWRNTKGDFGPFGHRSRVLFLSDNENAIKLMAINFYRGVERLVRQDLPPTMFTMSAWMSQGVPERNTLGTSTQKQAFNARKHATPTLLHLNAIMHHGESFGMEIGAEEWNTFQIFEKGDFEAFLKYWEES